MPKASIVIIYMCFNYLSAGLSFLLTDKKIDY